MSEVDLFSQVRYLLTELEQGEDVTLSLLNLLMEAPVGEPETALAVEYATQHLRSLWDKWKDSQSWVLYHHMFQHRVKQNPALVPLASCFWINFNFDSIRQLFEERSPLLSHIKALNLTPDFMSSLSQERNRMLDWLTDPLIARFLPELEYLSLESWQLGVATTKRLLTSPVIPSIKELNLSGNVIGIGGCKALAESRALSQLTTLKLRSCLLDHKRLKALLEMDGFANVVHLDLSYNPLDFQAVNEFLNTKALGALETLVLHNTHFVASDVRMLSQAPSLKGLKHLMLNFNIVGNEGLEGVANHLPVLETLNLQGAMVHDRGCQVIANGEGVENLRSLFLDGNKIGFSGFCSLLESRNLRNLRHLRLYNNNIGSGTPTTLEYKGIQSLESLSLQNNEINKHAVEVLVRGQNWERLEQLELSENRIVVRDARVLFEEGRFPVLRKLSLARNQIRNSAISLLLNAEGLPQLRELDLSYNQLDARMVPVLADSPFLSRLTSLSLAGCKLGKEGIQEFLTSPYLTRLERLDLSNCQMGFHGCRRFQKANLPNLKHLILQDNGLGDGSLRALLKTPWIGQLETLDLRNNRIDYGALHQSRRELTNLKDFYYGRSYSYSDYR
jgi:Ran GTPase-activating protein (RanGAP) involved in mRNA processing and transport